MCDVVSEELTKREWFVTGNVPFELFSSDFTFKDPDVQLSGIDNYARGVRRLFDQATSRAEIIACRLNATVPNTITIVWRLEGKVNVGLGLRIKPYVVFTDLRVSPSNGLIEYQEDRFSLPGWDIFL
ncbi:hypothetical protein GUITHDRAFT_111682 [Guillardia theta CCMP2712]|uniref:SnoaL-like domain-containing protein n=1 Tax=Guillardia theta (strain CCMP2712) TaxID=905079 RepID=L1J284_GUITC|nr:hypothetical protein GUITHDRAFT_111682 [Guillardia theta CCMP2712]EKX42407.1 hypothetical protein GUITHDRAFT_111682 [Guillardia theta CCMP2712]|eukprot:XP_005829387.1 hypothetical protein GUITHDRAFT_111682 [Guillardia theta CCMP2712]